MIDTELKLADAVRDAIIGGGLEVTNQICTVELDPNTIPATIGHKYVVVSPGGFVRGPRHRSSGGVKDYLYSTKVTVVVRTPPVARDRSRQLLTATYAPLRQLVDAIIDLVDYDYDIINAANAALTEIGQTGLFNFPLVFASIDPQPRVVASEVFSDMPGETKAGLARTIVFSDARRTSSRS